MNSSCAASAGAGDRASIASRSTTATPAPMPAVPLHRRVRAVRQDARGPGVSCSTSTCSSGSSSSSGRRRAHRPAEQLGDLGGVRPGPEVVDHHEHLRAGALQREGHLALPEDRHERAASPRRSASPRRRRRRTRRPFGSCTATGRRAPRPGRATAPRPCRPRRRAPASSMPGAVPRASTTASACGFCARPAAGSTPGRSWLSAPAAAGHRSLGRLGTAGAASAGAAFHLHRDAEASACLDEARIGDPVGVRVGQCRARPSAADAATASDISTRWSLNEDRWAPLSESTPRTRRLLAVEGRAGRPCG